MLIYSKAMNKTSRLICLLAVAILGLSGFSSCTLTATTVEPDLPQGTVNESNTVAYLFNGQAVVAHNYSDLGTLLIGPILSQFGGGGAPVQATLRPDGTLILGCVDAQNIVRPGYVQHGLAWQLTAFRGAGTYQPVPVGTVFQTQIRDAANETWLRGPVQPLATQMPAEVVVTEWNPTTRHLRGTFRLQFEAMGGTQAAEVRDGRFDLILAP